MLEIGHTDVHLLNCLRDLRLPAPKMCQCCGQQK